MIQAHINNIDKEWVDGCIHLSRRDVAYTFSDKNRPYSYMRVSWNHSNVPFYSINKSVYC
jgi:hypothetical protein